MDDLLVRLAACECRNQRLALVNVVLALVLVGLAAGSCRSRGSLTVSDLAIVDSKGVVRARIAGNLSDVIVVGKRVARGQEAAGLLLYDDSGLERGGFVTLTPSRNVALTLDNSGTQTATLLAGPEGGSALNLRLGDSAVDLRADEDGASVHVTKDKRAAFHEPTVEQPEKTALCQTLREARPRTTFDDLMAACRARSSEAACRACLGGEGAKPPR
jgi:hypothetical protein